MAEITVQDLLSWESRISFRGEDPDDENAGPPDAFLDREVSWAVTLRASMPILPPMRVGEVVILPDRILNDTGVPVDDILREIASRAVTGVIVDKILPSPSSLLTLWAEPIPPDLESDINRMLTEQRGEIYRAGNELGRLLTQANASGAGVEEVLAVAGAYLGFGAAVLSVREGVVAIHGQEIETALPDLPPRAPPRGWQGDFYGFNSSPAVALWLGPIPPTRRAIARLLSDRIGMAVESALAHARDVRPRGSARAQALAGLLAGSGADAGRLGSALGLPSSGWYVVMLTPSDLPRTALHRELSLAGTSHDAAEIDGYRAMLIELGSRGAHLRGLHRSASQLAEEQDSRASQSWIVLSEAVAGVSQIPAAARQARYLAALVAGDMLTGPLVRFDDPADVGIYRLLFPLWGSAELEAFVRDTLGPLLTRDRRGTLRRTLLAYLEAGGSQVEAATRLGVHRNTLAYRLKQIADMTGVDPTSSRSHIALHMALLAAGLPPSPDGDRLEHESL